MSNFLSKEKAVALVMAIGFLLVSIILANVLLTIMLSHSRLSQHQVGRIQAYYAAMAGVNYAFDQLREGKIFTSRKICSESSCDVRELDFNSQYVKQVQVTIGAPGSGISGTREVKSTVTFITRPTTQ